MATAKTKRICFKVDKQLASSIVSSIDAKVIHLEDFAKHWKQEGFVIVVDRILNEIANLQKFKQRMLDKINQSQSKVIKKIIN